MATGKSGQVEPGAKPTGSDAHAPGQSGLCPGAEVLSSLMVFPRGGSTVIIGVTAFQVQDAAA